ncbi:MAG: hypothetical protein CVU24_04480 [Betaproteobacteria bacterium HGW-Betaproteobacteria-18]|jgi:hypothetical protein|nr:MAG: hypothetical protein CVU32_01255 [Betaproteobacteria bacterium HGW-Betaproteobacteria-5]PKO40993.1 MAG: hypothetical protein CVU33_01375 [Betaproteobacteria bacterium HGW-Betaproteobacteria-6]PKO62343.1 MAG: hypothetical protein CVU24_04480 [Betaproteobacteria bacterium HGW-Betaproteobacteria-18]
MKMFSKDGIEMMEVKSIQQDGSNLLMKGKIMGSMATSIVIKPEDCWQALKLIGWKLLLRMPAILFQGYRRASTANSK